MEFDEDDEDLKIKGNIDPHVMQEHQRRMEMKRREQLNKTMQDKAKKEEEILSGKKGFLYKMNFPEVPLIKPDTPRLSVVGLENGMLSINNIWVPGAVLLFPYRYYMWGVMDAHEIKPHTLDIFKVVKPKPSYLIIGTGKYMVEFNDDIYDYFKDIKIKVEIMPTFEAVTHFNMCNEDEMNIAAAVIPNNL
eukprot:CAMPEP_0170524900 /NCGR_PEP_ID=MMETSP0209-20121228/10368_1 /TAXON_ID=665100 ORGANISM="Litonotus pictus, Strain P1" /NCGR_SAMPLE_ID=MMETSP0209 /ASSEMBLY_ACC=CAM_ASM_000301 /LENGTH=190 /DNA_ID=CAMNT_0010813873 /DNA_START=141 /DNA_END=713 /DNA_ORIENTATION=+